MARVTRLIDLATEAGMDLDEALVTLWDGGLNSLEGPDDPINRNDLRRARSALGLPNTRDLNKYAHWQERLRLSDEDFQQTLNKLGIGFSPVARNLPKGAIAKLRRLAEERRAPAGTPNPSRQTGTPTPAPPFQWVTVGRTRKFRSLTADELLQIHEALVEDFASSGDRIDPPGARSLDLVESCAIRPHTAIGDAHKYESVEMAAAALTHSIIHNHAFYNGNKRTALVAMLVFLDENDFTVTCHEDELFRFVLKVAQHKLVPAYWDHIADREACEIAYWIKRNSRTIEKAERLIKWHKLRQILTSYRCTLRTAKVGNRINIERELTERGLLGLPRKRTLRIQVAYGDEGREVERDTIKHIRRELQLDDNHGIDSAVFYGDAKMPSDFIMAYRKTLRRLAKL